MGIEPKNRKIGILGATGRMGRAAHQALTQAEGLEVSALFDVEQEENLIDDLPVLTSLEEFISIGPEVVIDFTVAKASLINLPEIAAAEIHAVVGTSGLTEEDCKFLDGIFNQSACLVVPNFAIGAVLMMKFAEMASPWFQTYLLELVEKKG